MKLLGSCELEGRAIIHFVWTLYLYRHKFWGKGSTDYSLWLLWFKGYTWLETDIDTRISLLLQVKWLDMRTKSNMFIRQCWCRKWDFWADEDCSSTLHQLSQICGERWAMFIRSSVLLRTWDLTSESRPACFNLSWVIINISNTRDALAVTVLGCNPIFPAEIYEKRSTGSLLHWENNPFWGTENNREVDDKIIILQEESGTWDLWDGLKGSSENRDSCTLEWGTRQRSEHWWWGRRLPQVKWWNLRN